MEGVHEHGDILDLGDIGVESPLTGARGVTEIDAVGVGCLTRVACGLKDVCRLDTGNANQIAIADALQEQVVTELNLVGTPQVAEARVGGSAADADDHGSRATGAVIRIGVVAIAEHKVDPIDGVDVACMHAENHTRNDSLGEILDHVLGGVETHKRFLWRKQVLFRRRAGRGIIQGHLMRIIDDVEDVRIAALDGRNDFIRLHEGVDERGHLARVNYPIEHSFPFLV